MNRDQIQKSLIIQEFSDFYEELIRLRVRALASSSLEIDDGKEGRQETLAAYIQRVLMDLLTSRYERVEKRSGGFAVRYYREAQYIMVALADEFFVHMDWDGRVEWQNNLLESRIFRTQVAGERFFENLDYFLQHRDARNSDIGVLYLLALGLGFRGRFKDNETVIDEYTRRLFKRVMSDVPHLFDDIAPMFPEAYEGIMEDQGTGSSLPNTRLWYLMMVGSLGIFFIVSAIIWSRETYELGTMLENILQWISR